MTIEQVWEQQQRWSAVAERLRSALQRARIANLCLIVLGSVTAVTVASGRLPAVPARWIGGLSAVSLSAAAFIQAQFLTSARVRQRLTARVTAESLKSLTYMYLVGAASFARPDRDKELARKLRSIEDRTDGDAFLLAEECATGPELPKVSSLVDYSAARVRSQRDWHARRAAEHHIAGRRWRYVQLADTLAAGALAAVGGAVEGLQVSAWVGALATIAAAVAAHVAGEQHERIAGSYVRTARSLDVLLANFDPGEPPSRRGGFVSKVEAVIAKQTDAWVELLEL
ncbi:hypothetical protein Xcel_2651 [Xylanimonas cellulosilytica DSM 15894]|uniref:SMODS and SLOG-associating 2TM effector domain-containing protein n=1 Tax=Xylanimonas cellulosilytica (strain DSM 15894 / JCM 12276 / CECT 5975 / KCTC 9989 / LMG 20990 / NBRC 107835 / XIL07) TaxID=446471 RepID=D1BX97_XYLCX|nr:DUF4231 domain-containing protein [Xylanimonas cellulosilytica]ACZ31665.1 hypothetical protein Xcel_2651 [Xylanimonas cellulosilytica DSM 15894]